MNRLLLLWLSLIIVVFACEPGDSDVLPGHDGPALRIFNESNFVIESLEVQPGGGGLQVYSVIEPGSTSDYKPFDFLYSYAYLKAVIGEDTLILQPIDYVGAQTYDNGAFTYVIGVTGDMAPETLTIAFRED